MENSDDKTPSREPRSKQGPLKLAYNAQGQQIEVRAPNPSVMPTSAMKKTKMMAPSVKSGVSVASQLIRSAEVKAKKRIMELKKEIADKAKEYRQQHSQLKAKASMLDYLRDLEDNGTANEEQKKEKLQLSLLIPELEASVGILKDELEMLQENFEDQKFIIEAELENEKEDINNEQILSSDDEQEGVEKVADPTASWVAHQAACNKRMSTSPKVNANEDADSVHNGDGTETVSYSPPSSVNGAASTIADHSPPPSNVDATSDIVTEDRLVKALAEVMKMGASAPRGENVILKTSVDKDLPHFNGSPEEWAAFKAEYDRTTTKYKFDDSDNLYRLRKALKGSAMLSVKHLFNSPNKLGQILETLALEFGKPKHVIEALIKQVDSVKGLDPSKHETFIDFGRVVEALVSSIKAHQQNDYLNSACLLNKLVGKLPEASKLKWMEWLISDEQRKENLESFALWMKMQKRLHCELYTPVIKKDDGEKRKNTEKKTAPKKSDDERKDAARRGPAAIHHVSTDDRNSGRMCPCCDRKRHLLNTCWAFEKLNVDERWDIVRRSGVCFGCLKPGHRTSSCNECGCPVQGCTRRHHELLHKERNAHSPSPVRNRERRPERNQTPRNKSPVPRTEQRSTQSPSPARRQDNLARTPSGDREEPAPIQITPGNIGVTTTVGTRSKSIVPVRLRAPNGRVIKTYALLDTGADTTIMERDLADQLGLAGTKCSYTCIGVGGRKMTDDEARIVSVEVQGAFRNSKFYKLNGVPAVETLGLRSYSIDFDGIRKQWPHLRKMAGRNMFNAKPQIIIGLDNQRLIANDLTLEGPPDAPTATRCPLGWVLGGKFGETTGFSTVMYTVGEDHSDAALNQIVKNHFAVENMGVVPVSNPSSINERKALATLEMTTKFDGTSWETGLLWRDENVALPPSKSNALNRLVSIEKRMKRDPTFADMYRSKFKEYLDKGYMMKVDPNMTCDNRREWYIPHFGVYNPNKPGKLRLVFDAAAKSAGVSLNDKLFKGPDLIRPITSVLMNFRRHNVVLTGDIADMFHRVRVREEDQVSQRFLWRDGDMSREPDIYQLNRLMFGSTSSPTSAIYVKDKNADRFAEQYPEAVRATKEDMYVDDCLTGADSTDDAIKLRQDLSFINDSGNFHLCKWTSNSPLVLSSIPAELRAEGVKDFEEKATLPTERVLGLWYDPVEDVFTFKTNFHKVEPEILEGRQPTKREMSRLVMSLYDPLGFIGHYKIKGIMMLQGTWRTDIGWDDEVPDTIYDDWKVWLEQLPETTNVKIPRQYYFGVSSSASEMHMFVDASEEAFAAVCYLRSTTGVKVVVAFVGSKARVSPIRKLTIPRLELQAALLGARLAQTVKEELNIVISATHFWSDSRTVLCWLRSESARFKEFVANRVCEIQDITCVGDWHWVPTALNVADDATRFSKPADLSPTSRWFNGPDFLKDEPEFWPREKTSKTDDFEAEVFAIDTEPSESPYLVEPTKFSNYNRLVRATAGVHAAAKHWMRKTIRKDDVSETFPPCTKICVTKPVRFISHLQPDQIETGEKLLLKATQEDAFSDDLDSLSLGEPLPKGSKIKKLSPYLESDGLIRMSGRIGAAEAPDDTKHQIILPAKNHVVDLLIDREHVANAHQGQETVFNNLQQRFWITDGRNAVKKAWIRCWTCKVRKAKPIVPEMGSLPHYRLAYRQPCFTFTGVDFFGPMLVKVGRNHEKRWGVLFTCMVTRAVHLEVAHGMSTDDMLMVLSRFIDTRGRPKTIISDNGTNLTGANNEMKRAFRDIDFDRIRSLQPYQLIEWKFIPPGTPHMGGCWERLIQCVKKAMNSILKERYPSDQILLTVLKSAENIVNSRP